MTGLGIHPPPSLPTRGGAALERALVALDLSPRSARALRRALLLPWRAEGGELLLVHVLPEEADPARQEEVRQALTRAFQEATHGAAGPTLRVQPLVTRERPHSAVGQLAHEARAQLVVVGQPHAGTSWLTRGRGRPGGGLLQAVQAPLLVVGPEPERPYRHPLVAVDFTPASRRALAHALALCPQAREVTVVHTYEAPADYVLYRTGASAERVLRFEEELAEEMRQSLGAFVAPVQREGLPFHLVARRSVPERDAGLCQLATRVGADLLALGRHARPGLGQLLRPHLAEAVLPHACCDVLVEGLEEGPG